MSETHWLNDEERELWMRLVSLTTLLPSALETQLRRDAGTNLFDYHVLAMLSDAPDSARLMSDLAFHTNSSLSRLSHVVTRLEKLGWVRREACPTDGRATIVVLTDAGQQHLVDNAPQHVREVRRMVFDAIDPAELTQLSRQLARILETVDPERRRLSDDLRE